MRKYYVTSDTSLYHTFLLKRGLAVSRIRNFSAVAPNAEREFVYPEYYRIIGNPDVRSMVQKPMDSINCNMQQ